MKARPHVFTPLTSIAPHTRSSLNDFQKRLLKDGEFGYFEKKARQEGATTALAAFTSFYTNIYQDNVLYLTHNSVSARIFRKLVEADCFDNYMISHNHSYLTTSTLYHMDWKTIGQTFELIIIDEINTKYFTDADISELAAHDTLNTIWLSTTNMI